MHLGVECTKMVAFNALTSGYMNWWLNRLKKLHLWSSYTIFLTNNTVARWLYENGSIQRSYMRIYELVFKSAKKTHLWSSYTIFLTNNGFGRCMNENGSIQRSNIRTYELRLNQLNKTFAIFIQNIPYHFYCWASTVRKW